MSKTTNTLAIATLVLALPLAACDPDVEEPTREEIAAVASEKAEPVVETEEPEPVVETEEPEPTTEEPTEEPEPEPTEEPTEESTTDFGEQVISERGNLVKSIGQPAGLGPEDGDPTVTFTLVEVERDYECPGDPAWVEPPLNGHYVAFHWVVDTGAADAMAEAFYDSSFTLSEWGLVVLDGSGKRVNDISGNAMFCYDSASALPSMIGPKQHAEGIILLDLPDTTGTLIVDGTYLGVQDGGWEWEF